MEVAGAVEEVGGEGLVGRLQGGCGKTLDMRLEMNPVQVEERLGEVGGSYKKLRMAALMTLSGVLLMSIVTMEVGKRGVEGETY